MKKNHLFLALALVLLPSSVFAAYFGEFTTPVYEARQTFSNYIYVSGSGYSPNVKPYQWQATPPTGPEDWITDDLNQTNVTSSHLSKWSDGKKAWAATGGVYDSTPPTARRTELWHPLNEPGKEGHLTFTVGFAVIPSKSTRADDTFGWAFKNLSGKILFQILFKPNSDKPRHTLDVWESDQNGVETKTPLTISYGEKYNLSIIVNLAAQSYRGFITTSRQALNFSGKVGHGEATAAHDPIGSVAAVWSLTGQDYGNNFMVFTSYNVGSGIGAGKDFSPIVAAEPGGGGGGSIAFPSATPGPGPLFPTPTPLPPPTSY